MLFSVNDKIVNNFVGRQQTVQALLHHIDSIPEVIVITGQRCIGKTWLLQYLGAKLQENPTRSIIYKDVSQEAHWEPVRFFAEGIIQHIYNTLSATRHVSDNGIPLPIDKDMIVEAYKQYYEWLIDNLTEDQQVILILDDFDTLIRDNMYAEEFITIFRAMFTEVRNKKIQYILAIDSTIDALSSQVSSAEALFNKQVKVYHLKSFDLNELNELFESIQENKPPVIHATPETREHLHRLTGGHPQLTQCLLETVIQQQVIERGFDDEIFITIAYLDKAKADLLKEMDSLLQWIWLELDPFEKHCMVNLIRHSKEYLLPDEVASILCEEPEVSKRIPQDKMINWLIDHNLIYLTENNDAILRNGLLVNWIQQNKGETFANDFISTPGEAEMNYKLAKRIYEKINLSERERNAIELYLEQASNKDYLPAQILTALYLDKIDRTEKAIEQLEELYRVTKENKYVKHALVQLLHDYAERLPPVKKQKYLERVVELRSEHIDAQDELAEIYLSQVKQALQDNLVEEAVEICQKISSPKGVEAIYQLALEYYDDPNIQQKLYFSILKIALSDPRNSIQVGYLLEAEPLLGASLEKTDSWADYVQLYTWLSERDTNPKWKENIRRGKHQKDILDRFTDAVRILSITQKNSQKWRQAQQAIIDVIKVNPFYSNAVEELFISVRGYSPEEYYKKWQEQLQIPQEISDRKVINLNLPNEIQNRLESKGIHTIGELWDLLKQGAQIFQNELNVGENSLREIVRSLYLRGFWLILNQQGSFVDPILEEEVELLLREISVWNKGRYPFS